jgi:hypothetical protein
MSRRKRQTGRSAHPLDMWAIGDQLNDDPGALPKLKAQFSNYSDKTFEEAKRMSSRFPRAQPWGYLQSSSDSGDV